MPLCGYLNCDEPASHQVTPAYGRPWFRCKEHLAQAQAVLKEPETEEL